MGRHTTVTFLTLRAVMPLSPPFLDSMAASFIKLRAKLAVTVEQSLYFYLRLHEQDIVEEYLALECQVEALNRVQDGVVSYWDVHILANIAV